MEEQQEKIELLKKIAHRFNEAHVVWALGAVLVFALHLRARYKIA